MKKITKLMVTFFATLMLLCVISAVLPEAAGVQTVEAATIKISRTSLSLEQGKAYRLKVTGTNKKVTWKSSNSQVATVGSKGKVTAKKAGMTSITAKVGNQTYTCKVTVFRFSVSSTSVTVNKTGSVTVTSKNNGTVRYHIGNPDIISCKWAEQLDSNTRKLSITGKSIGSTKITISNTKNNKKLVVSVRVTQGAKSGRTVLMEYLNKYGSTNSDGNKFIRSTLKTGNYTYTYGIVYNAKATYNSNGTIKAPKDSFSFTTISESRSDKRTLHMVIPNSIVTSASPNVLGSWVNEKKGYNATAKITISTYSKNTNVIFTVNQKTGSITNAEVRESANGLLRSSMSGWNVLLKEKVRITMKDMGFLAYA